MRRRRRIVIGGLTLFLLFGCNNGGEERLASEKRLGEIGRSAENVFYSFVDFIADTLGFTAKATTKKEDVGKYFSGLGEKLGKASEELEKVAKQSETDGDKEGLLSKAIREAVDSAKTTLNTLKGHLDSLKGIGDENVVGYATATQTQGAAASETELKNAHKALKGIVGIAEKEGVKKPEAGSIALQIGSADNKAGAKILAVTTGNPSSSSEVGQASSILASVSGKEMLASIVNSKEDDAALKGNADDKTTAMSFALGGTATQVSNAATPKAAAVAGGIALRALVKNGQLSAGANAKSAGGQEEVQGIGITAANKLLGAIEDIIKKTVKSVLMKVKQEVDKARDSKATVQ